MDDLGARINLKLIEELRQYGEFNVQNCFSCGHCTAVCNLVQPGESFPRRVIRYAQLGLRDQLAATKAVWSCYYCGDCTLSCPRQATPGQLMEAARRYFIVHWDITTLSRRFYTSPRFMWVSTTVMAVILGFLFLATGGDVVSKRLALFEFMSYDFLHYLGIAVIALVALLMMINAGNMAFHVMRVLPKTPATGPILWIRDALLACKDILDDMTIQSRFSKCRGNESEASLPWYLSRRVIHLCIMWGFLGLLGATTFDFIFKEPGSYVPLYYPGRLLGTVAGIPVLYGTSVSLWLRKNHRGGASFERTMLSDWFFLWLLWVTTITGYITEVAVYLPRGSILGYGIFLIHVILAIELILILPFTKFSHVIYRPVALYLHALHLRRRARGYEARVPLAVGRPSDIPSSA
ncbi:MAG: 4Fe-4S dicluster domain-containing protein [Deltaproteobacteria bacterium]|nr:4Fe-4S dicluster domain-containing protein [Deltaproteobacteria bacterium]